MRAMLGFPRIKSGVDANVQGRCRLAPMDMCLDDRVLLPRKRLARSAPAGGAAAATMRFPAGPGALRATRNPTCPQPPTAPPRATITA